MSNETVTPAEDAIVCNMVHNDEVFATCDSYVRFNHDDGTITVTGYNVTAKNGDTYECVVQVNAWKTDEVIVYPNLSQGEGFHRTVADLI